MTPMINLLNTKTESLEKQNRYVVKSLLDVLQSNISDARNTTEHVFFKGELTNIAVWGESDKITGLQLNLYQFKNNSWSFVRTYQGGSEINTNFKSPESALFKLEVTATFRAGNNYTHFGLLINHEQ